ncbi:LOW QUALITY PROTEIN: protein OS-9-like [Rhipicephalus sanguineus]|uniref:LOW QUALITY PROTEIN: protein OS-9-like n=1 Tax=Rhipicephalus sanguineus TaxID=34632 RepID=UPI001895726E|nr:LOW QUALITY PROTEIN: protein OS-9-like [Rhipicephalus sanguineus]
MITSATLLLLFIQCAIAYFNVEELRSFKYEVDIVSTPVKISDDIGASVMLMTTKFGQEYQCSLPENSYPTEHAESDDPDAEAPDVLKLLEPLRNAPCLTKTRNWWTYELCYGKSIKQFHVENGKPEGAIIFLGLYDYDFDWNNETNLEQFNKTGQQKYHSQVYSHGSKCDITGVPRRAEVRYFCDEESTDYIDSVEEPETCSYVFTVQTSRVCAFPPLKRISPSKPHTISCSPRLTEKQYQKYLEVKENEKKLEEEKRKLWLLEQQKNLEAIKSFVKKEPSITNLEKPVVDIKEAQTEVPAETQDDEAPVLENTRNDVAKQFKEVFSKKGEGDLHDEATAQFKDDSQADMNVVLERLMKRLKQMEADAEADAEEGAGSTSQQHVAEGQQSTEHLGEPEDATQDATGGEEVVGDEYDGDDSGPLVSREGHQDAAEGDYEDNSGYPGEDGQEDPDASKQGEEGDVESQAGAETEPEEVGSLRVRIRRYGQRKSKEPGKKTAKYQELDLPSEDKSKLETALRDRLQKAGVSTGGRKIEVKIITAGYYDDEEAKGLNVLSPEETRQFQNMIVTLLMGNQEATQEIEKHLRLEKNYNFVWNNEETDTDAPASTAEDEEER